MRHAKIVCTLGPSTRAQGIVDSLVRAGMDVARLNLSHGSFGEHRAAADSVRTAAAGAGKRIGILVDLSGPKIRLGDLPADRALAVGETVAFSATATGDDVPVQFAALANVVQPGASLFVEDGRLEFEVLRIDGQRVVCRSVNGGTLRSRKGLNIPGGGASLPALTEKDKQGIEFGKSIAADFFALSFVRRPSDLLETKVLAGDVPVIAKIEKPMAIANLPAICDAADGLMVARGDLGVEVGAEKVPLLQKEMISLMRRRAKPVITATQMLDSMVERPTPTRAEVSDVANAILDGTDAVMLSAETASGKYPVAAVETMVRIIEEVEETAYKKGMLKPAEKVATPDFDHAIAHAAAQVAIDLDLKMVVVFSFSGKSTAMVSAFRPRSRILGFSTTQLGLGRMTLSWGVEPIGVRNVTDLEEAFGLLERELIEKSLATPGDHIAVAFASEVGFPVGATTMRLWTIGAGETRSLGPA